MMLMEWSESLETGIETVDTQHRWLVDAINALHDEVTKPTPDTEVVEQVLLGLVDYTYNHFIMEESLFQQHGYADETAHRAEHNRFTAKAAALLETHDRGELPADEAMAFLKDWLTHHIMKVDMAYVPFLKGKGVT
jgi:hemerythrin